MNVFILSKSDCCKYLLKFVIIFHIRNYIQNLLDILAIWKLKNKFKAKNLKSFSNLRIINIINPNSLFIDEKNIIIFRLNLKEKQNVYFLWFIQKDYNAL